MRGFSGPNLDIMAYKAREATAMNVFRYLSEFFGEKSRPDGDYGLPKIQALSNPSPASAEDAPKQTKRATSDYGGDGSASVTAIGGGFGCDGGVCAPEMR